jgi:hypothetical protein
MAARCAACGFWIRDPEGCQNCPAKPESKSPPPLLNSDLVTVCAECGEASCWLGIFMCEDNRTANTKQITVGELRKISKENEDYWRRASSRPPPVDLLGPPTGDCESCGHPAYAGQTICHCSGKIAMREPTPPPVAGRKPRECWVKFFGNDNAKSVDQLEIPKPKYPEGWSLMREVLPGGPSLEDVAVMDSFCARPAMYHEVKAAWSRLRSTWAGAEQ